MSKKNIAIFPGSFDPITLGHLDIITRSSKIFEKVIIIIANNSRKKCLFPIDIREKQVKKACLHFNNIQVERINGLLVKEIEKFNPSVIIRGLRTISDFEYESAMAMMNKKLNDKFETLFLIPNNQYSFISSQMIREILINNGDISSFVPSIIIDDLSKTTI